MAGSSGSKHPSRQDAAGKDSPNRHSKVSLCLALPDPTLSHPGSEACSDWLPPGIFPGYMADEGWAAFPGCGLWWAHPQP